MRVFTHFYPINRVGDKEEGFRWRTLLQFGDSWNCIGSVVMKNPGSSVRKNDMPINDTTILNHLMDYDESSDPWYEFDSDNTMINVAQLFAFKYGKQHHSSLSGVVQIFNLFYVRDADLGSAMKKASQFGCLSRFENEVQMTQYDCDHLIGPVYLGFSDLAKNKLFTSRARMFFETVKSKHCGDYLFDDFLKNSFTHPQSLMRNVNSSVYCRRDLLRFAEGTTNSSVIDETLASMFPQYGVSLLVQEKTGADWFLCGVHNYCLRTQMKAGKMTIGIEGWFHMPKDESDGLYHPFITVWNTNSFGQYLDSLQEAYYGCPIDDHGQKKRLFLNLPQIDSTDPEIISDMLNGYYSKLRNIIDNL